MKSSRTTIIAVTLAIALLVAVGAVAQTVKRAHMHGGGYGMFGAPGWGFLAHRLDLSDAQRAQMKQILAKEKPVLQPLLAQMTQNRHQERVLVQSGTFDEAKVRALAAQQTQTMTELMVQRARIESELYQVLTTDQQTKLNQMLDQREQRFMQHLQQQPQQPVNE